MRIMYTRANLRVRLFLCTVSALADSATLQTVESHEFLRSVEEGGPVIPLNNKGLTKLHFVIYVYLGVRYAPKSRHSRDIVLNDRL